MFVQLTKPLLGRKAGERLDLADADARALVASGAATAVADDPLAPALTRAVEGALARHQTGDGPDGPAGVRRPPWPSRRPAGAGRRCNLAQ